MQRQKVNSSNINSIGYDDVANVLEVEFSSNDVYQYTNVPMHIYKALMGATSIGSYFASNIKDSFPFRKI